MPPKLTAKLTQIKKRDGRLVDFDLSRISNAVFRAMQSAGEGDLKYDPQRVSAAVVKELEKEYGAKNEIPDIENIQDVVERELILTDFPKTAKAYILYRHKRAEIRKQKKRVPLYIEKLARESKKYFRNALAEFIFYRSYSRWLEKENRRETWIETVDRYFSFMKENLGDKLSLKEYQEIREAVLCQEVMPSMRLLWSAGSAARATNVAAYNCITGDTKILTKEFGLILIEEAYQYGAAHVLSHNAKWHKAVINYFGEQNVTDLIMVKGRRKVKISCTLDHKWFVNGNQFKTTTECITSGKKWIGDKIIPVFAPKPSANNKSYRAGIIHGIVYGDGTTTKKNGKKTGHMVRLCKDNVELLKYFEGYKHSYPKSYQGDAMVYLYDRWAKKNDLKSLPCDAPPSYILGFIRGWIAADGSINKKSQTILASNKVGIEWLQKYSGTVGLPTGNINLFQSETNYGIRSEPLYRIYFFHGAVEEKDLLNSRHKAYYKSVSGNLRYDAWTIHSISKHLRKEKVYCATVSDTGTFLLGEGIVTGNCSFIAPAKLKDFSDIMYVSMCGAGVGFSVESQTAQALPQIKKQSGRRLKTHLIEDSKEGWCGALTFGLKTWFSGKDVDFDYSRLRPEGARLKTMGGKSSGHGPLKELLNFSRDKILARQGRRLSNIDVYDLICKIGEIVVSGGVRRSALISLSDLDDQEMRDAKKGQFYLKEPQRSLANNSAVYNQKPSGAQFLEEWLALMKSGSGERGIFNRGGLGKQMPLRRWKKFKKDIATAGTNPCGEIILKNREFCNLSEVVARREDGEKSLLRKTRLAAILGTYQSMLADFHFISKEWKKNCEEERLLGVSITGQWDSPASREPKILRKMRETAVKVNQEYAKKFGINFSAAVTCVKPSGTVSQLVDASSGMHSRHSPYYIRRIRISATDSLFQMLKDQKVPYKPEVGQFMEDANTYIVEFPIKSPKGAIFRNNLSALDQLEYWKKVKENFTEHNPSVTISVGEEEWVKVAHWLYENWEMIGGLSFLPREDHIYKLAPYEEITKEQYEELAAKFPKVDFSQIVLYEMDDTTEGAKELACAAGACEI